MPTGSQMARSSALGVMAFMTTATAISATTTQIATGSQDAGSGAQTSNPARFSDDEGDTRPDDGGDGAGDAQLGGEFGVLAAVRGTTPGRAERECDLEDHETREEHGCHDRRDAGEEGGIERHGRFLSGRYIDMSSRYSGGMPRGTQTDLAVLAALSVQPMTGYALRDAIRMHLGAFWSESFGQIYPALARLRDEGLVGTVGGERPGSSTHHLTASGRGAARRTACANRPP